MSNIYYLSMNIIYIGFVVWAEVHKFKGIWIEKADEIGFIGGGGHKPFPEAFRHSWRSPLNRCFCSNFFYNFFIILGVGTGLGKTT